MIWTTGRNIMKQHEVEGDDAVKPNVCCVIADSLRWDVFVTANPTNILRLGRVRKAYSIANSTLPAMHGFLMNYPPIGIGKALFVEGETREINITEGDTIIKKYRRWTELRKWMPRYFQEQGYFTIWMSGNPVIIRVNEQLDGVYRRYFDHFGADEYQKLDVATPQIIRDLNLEVKLNKIHPIFAVILLLDTHSPYHDGERFHLIDPSQPDMNYEHQLSAMKFINNIFPNFVKIFSQTERPTEFIFMSDHGDNFGGPGWGHNSFRRELQFGEKLFAIPFVRGRIDDWSTVHVGEPGKVDVV
ncbi:hypothetical protein LCGC14_2291020 [marine sediment metagenome]|uniref:Sulfatase N-terminal domain-containing protein n=1 Tax=marine sediment metagenome TaxID=412755 RepID=A0A0F9CRT9_9ZZZZ